ncbi:MAG: DNA double-strand break repair nuclease NurA [Candidatus Thermochlorobacter sp.]
MANYSSEEGVRADLQRQPSIMLKLAENALQVAESLRGNYLKNTARLIALLRQAMLREENPILKKQKIKNAEWSQFQGETVAFVDGGVGQVEISGPVPVLLRVGSYVVKSGERNLVEREKFGYYPVILGDLEGGTKERHDFIDIVRIIAELLGSLSILESHEKLNVLMLHGPLVYTVNHYTGHTPFTENDIDKFLSHYGAQSVRGRQIKEDFLKQAFERIYPELVPNTYQEWSEKKVFEPLSFMAYLLRQIIQESRKKNTLVIGAVERGTQYSEFSRLHLLKRVFEGLRQKKNVNFFNDLFGRNDLNNPDNVVYKLGYTDTIFMSLLLEEGEYSEIWEMTKQYDELRTAQVSLPNQARREEVNYAPLKSGEFGFPTVLGSYVKVADNVEPIRVETFGELQEAQMHEAIKRVYLYSKLMPQYGFPVGLDIADKYAHIPNWLTESYSKLIKYHLGVSLQKGEISDTEMRKVLIQTIYMTHRDWLFRPKS